MAVHDWRLVQKQLLLTIVERSHNSIGISDADGVLLQVSPDLSLSMAGELGDYLGRSVYQLESEGEFPPSVSALVLRERREVQVMLCTVLERAIAWLTSASLRQAIATWN